MFSKELFIQNQSIKNSDRVWHFKTKLIVLSLLTLKLNLHLHFGCWFECIFLNKFLHTKLKKAHFELFIHRLKYSFLFDPAENCAQISKLNSKNLAWTTRHLRRHMLYISISIQVLRSLFTGQNKLFCHFPFFNVFVRFWCKKGERVEEFPLIFVHGCL